jgi:hypothetical protein
MQNRFEGWEDVGGLRFRGGEQSFGMLDGVAFLRMSRARGVTRWVGSNAFGE